MGGHNVGKLSECLAVYVDTNRRQSRQAGRGQKNVLLTSLFGPALPCLACLACHLLELAQTEE